MGLKKAHTRYYSEKRGHVEVPGVTTITGLLANKGKQEALMKWSYTCGQNGIDYLKERDDKGDTGTLAHALVRSHLTGEPLPKEFSDQFTPNQMDEAENSLLSFFEWAKAKELSDFRLEQPVISEEYGFGGTPDYYGKVNGLWTVMDWKTGRAIYDENFYQVAGYAIAILEEGLPVEQLIVVNIPRTEDENFQYFSKTEWGNYESVFLLLVRIYEEIKVIKSLNKENRSVSRRRGRKPEGLNGVAGEGEGPSEA